MWYAKAYVAKVFDNPLALDPIAGASAAQDWRAKMIAAGTNDAVTDAQACMKRMTGGTTKDADALRFFWNQLIAENRNDVEGARRKLWNAAYARICKTFQVPDTNSTAGRDYLRD